ncbi:MAG: hypothetical protein ACI4EU_03235 [Butyrivibrio sp.]
MVKTDNYEDIINLPHHTSSKRPRMPVANRAAQFAPFSALTVYGDAVKETARLTGKRIELDESEKQLLNERMRYIREHLDEHPAVSFTYFVPDDRKSGGEYVTLSGNVRKIDDNRRCVIMDDGAEFCFDDIVAIADKSDG